MTLRLDSTERSDDFAGCDGTLNAEKDLILSYHQMNSLDATETLMLKILPCDRMNSLDATETLMLKILQYDRMNSLDAKEHLMLNKH
jgi:hypothetical protein